MTMPPSVTPASGRRGLAEGELIDGRFVLGPLIGKGATGTVYAAVAEDSGQKVALKFIHRHLITDRQVERRFYREAELLRRLNSPHLVGLLAFGQHDGLLYLALELAPGESLETLMLREPTMAPKRAVAILLDVCEALAAAHAAGIIHRDLKPSNVMIEPREAGELARVLDFGMAKMLHGEGINQTMLTEPNMVFGTPEYMAPEQARGDELDETCDVYAAGAILYEMLTGNVPFVRPTTIATMTAVLVDRVPTPSQRAPDRPISPALETVVMCALEKVREDRYPSARALREALVHARDSFAGREGALSPTIPLRPVSRRPSTEAAHLAAARTSENPRAESDADARTPNWGPAGWALLGFLASALGIAIGIWISLR